MQHYTLVQSYGSDTSVLLDGRTYQVPAVVEDQDGLRWYLTDGLFHVKASHYARGVANGICALLAPLGDHWVAMTVEDFMENRAEVDDRYSTTQGISFPEPPTYPELADTTGTILADGESDEGQCPQGLDGHSCCDCEAPAGPEHFAHLHTHFEYSPMDGRTRVVEGIKQVVEHGQRAVAMTDHGLCAGHPELQIEAKKAGVKSIFGTEAYFVDDRKRRPVEWWEDENGNRVPDATIESTTLKERRDKFERKTDQKEVSWGYYHLTLLAKDQVGLRNLWGASTASQRTEAFYQVPRMDWEVLREHAEGMICLSGCLRGPLAKPIVDGDDALARENLGRLLDIFGDRLYLEVMPNDLAEQVKVNQTLAAYSVEYGIPLVATVDSHYPTDAHFPEHQVWVSSQTAKDIGEESELFAKDLGLYLKSEQQVIEGLAPQIGLDVATQAVYESGRIADMCTAEIPIQTSRPIFSRKGGMARDEERLLDLCLDNWHLTMGNKRYDQDTYRARFEYEFNLLVKKGFCGYFLQVSDYVLATKKAGGRVGPGRGSGAGSLVAFLSRITGVDPVEAELIFERFMTEGREALPDFDVDFPTTWRPFVQDYISGRYGEDNVVRVGTHLRLKNKGVFQALFRTLASTLPETAWKDAKEISDIIGAAEAGTAGLGLSFEQLMGSESELLQPYIDKYPKIFTLAESLVGILKSYGKHPAGLVVAEESLVDSLPLRQGDESQMITQFDMEALESMGYIKFDILTLRTLDTIQETVDLIERNRGIVINPDDWVDEYEDPQVWDTIGSGHTLGMFQIETASGIRMCKEMQPTSISDLSDVTTLVRPGPMRSGLTALYLDRRKGNAEVTYPDPRMEKALSKTYGCLVYQEDIMQACMILGGYNSNEADEVRKILGKKKVEKVLVAGQEFVERAAANGMEREAAEDLWEQMAEFAKYSFNRAHAYSYAMVAYWTAWLKVHYPVEFFTAVLSTVKDERIPEFVSEARRMGFKILPPDVNESRATFSCQGLNVRYGLKALGGLGDASVEPILANQPYSSFEDFRERSGVDSGKVLTLARVGALDNLVPNRRGLVTLLTMEKTGDAAKCQFKDEDFTNAYGLPCHFDWESEPPPVNPRTGKTLAAKPPPKKCTKACRQYLAPEPLDISRVEPYEDADVRDLEMEILGLHLSSTVWDTLDPEQRAMFAEEAAKIEDGPERTYLLAVTVSRIRKHVDRSGGTMAFLGLVTEHGEIDVTCFSKSWVKFQDNMSVGDLRYVEVAKNDRGINLMYVAIP